MSGGGARPGADLDLLVIGDCNPDVVVMGEDVTPAFGQQEKLVDSASMVIGGSASIMAVAAARLGLRVALVAAVGADAAGEFMIGRLAAEGVDTTGIVIRPDLTTALTVVLAQGSDRAILTAAGAMSHSDQQGRVRRLAGSGPAPARQLVLPARAVAGTRPGGSVRSRARDGSHDLTRYQLGSR